MAGLSGNALTLVDHAKRLDPDGKAAKIAELLEQKNEALQDIVWVEGNLPHGHRYTVRTTNPTVSFRLLNQGVQPTKSTTAQADEACAMLEAWSEVDVRLADLGGDPNGFRLSEASAFLEAMNQEAMSTFFYGNAGTDPEEFTGFAPRYNSLSGANAENILSAGGSGSDNSSIWLIGWNDQTIHGIYPKGTQAGLKHKDHGKGIVETVAGIAGSRMEAYRDQWTWDLGLCVRDTRFAVRIPNIDISALTTETSAPDLFKLMIKATHRVPSLNGAKFAWYANRSVVQMLDIQARNNVAAGGGLTYENVDGKPKMSFRGVPFRVVDALHELETVVS